MTVLDWILLAALVLVLPAEALWNTVARRERPTRPLSSRLLRSLRLVAVLLAFLFLIWWLESRSPELLGLDVPISTAGLIGLAASTLILGALAAAILLKKPGGGDAKPEAQLEMLPKTRLETVLFVLFGFAAGIGWELLYRGYLLWALTPLVGTVAAVIVAAIAYGLGHGSRDTRSLIGATIASFLFTIAYALTGSLWWLILLHSGLPMLGLLAQRVSRPART